MKLLNISISRTAWVIGAIVFAGGLKLTLFLANKLPFNADQAIDALMARHILNGAQPIFFYGQEYMGSLDSWLLAAVFRLFGESLGSITLVQGLLFSGTILTTAWIGWIVFENQRIGQLAAWLLAISTVNVTLYTSINMGVYGEILLLGNLIALIGLKIGLELKSFRLSTWHQWMLLGLVAGLGFWALPLTLAYTIPVAGYLIATAIHLHQVRGASSHWRRNYSGAIALVFGGAVVGSAPLWFYTIQTGFTQLSVEFSNWISSAPLAEHIGLHLLNFIFLGIPVIFGFRPPWTLEWLGWPLIPFILAFWAAVLVWTSKTLRAQGDRTPEKLTVLCIIPTLIVGFIFSPLGRDPSGRYFLPLAIPLALFGANLIIYLSIRYGKIAYGLLSLILAYNLWGTVQGILSFPPGLTTQFDVITSANPRTIYDLRSFLEAHGETRGYTNYWVAYPLAFFSNEELIFVPRLPYHLDFSYTTRDDRYAPYDQIVASASRVAYITTNFPDLDEYLRAKFTSLGIEWDEEQIGDFHVFFDLSTPVRVDEVDLGFDYQP